MTGQLTDILVELGYQGEDYSANYHCVFFFFDFFQHRLFRSIILEIWTKCTFCLRGGNASKKIVIINRQAFDATNRAEIFLLPFRIANTIGKEVKLCRYSPTS